MNNSYLQDYTQWLTHARRRIHITSMKRRAWKSLERGMQAGAVLGVLLLIRSFFPSVSGNRGLIYGIIIMVAAIMGVAIINWLPVLFRKPHLREAAERLDLGAGRHNIIASGLYFAQSTKPDDFSQAAALMGLDQLRKLKDGMPAMDLPLFSYRRFGVLSLWIILSLLISYTLQRGDRELRFARQGEPSLTLNSPQRPWEELEQKKDAVVMQNHRISSVSHSQKNSEPAEASQPGPNQAGEKTPAEAAAASASVGSHQNSLQHASGYSSQATMISDEKKTNSMLKPKAKIPDKTAAQPRESAQRPTESKTQNSSMNQGHQGGGEMPTTANTWLQESQAGSEASEDDSVYQEIEEQPEGNSHRGGIQPHLKDRNPAPSRDLGISGDQGQPGTGRGGPTPPKKSRGTASLVLGIPIPDFVRGRLGPGVNKVVREKIEPVAMTGESAVPATLTETEGTESPLKRYEPPFSLGSVVRHYLVRLHTQSFNQGDDDALMNQENGNQAGFSR